MVTPLILRQSPPKALAAVPAGRPRPLTIGRSAAATGARTEVQPSPAFATEPAVPVPSRPYEREAGIPLLDFAPEPLPEIPPPGPSPGGDAAQSLPPSVELPAEQMAARLERIAQAIREGGSNALLTESSSDPLTALITGFLLGSSRPN